MWVQRIDTKIAAIVKRQAEEEHGDAELDVRPAVGACLQSGGDQAAGFVPVDGSAPFAGHVAVAGVNL
jgi:hypothetical protein